MGDRDIHSGRWKKLRARLKRERPSICWYCGEDIDQSLVWPDPMCWTLDHIIQRADAPELTFDESNLTPAHKTCNESRGSRGPKDTNFSQDWG